MLAGTLRRLLLHWGYLACRCDKNNMFPNNLAVCIAPHLFSAQHMYDCQSDDGLPPRVLGEWCDGNPAATGWQPGCDVAAELIAWHGSTILWVARCIFGGHALFRISFERMAVNYRKHRARMKSQQRAPRASKHKQMQSPTCTPNKHTQ